MFSIENFKRSAEDVVCAVLLRYLHFLRARTARVRAENERFDRRRALARLHKGDPCADFVATLYLGLLVIIGVAAVVASVQATDKPAASPSFSRIPL